MDSDRKQRAQALNVTLRSRRPTIISPAGFIHDYHWHAFTALILVGCLLAAIAGYINTICVLGIYHAPLTALTGSTSKMVITIGQGSFDGALHCLLLIFSFTLGSSISAALVGGRSFKIQHHYGLVLLLESLAFVFAHLLEGVDLGINAKWNSFTPGAYLICLGFGLQNGMCTTFSGAVIRTTHVTGTLTDIGLVIGQAIFYPRTRKHLWKLKVLVPLYVAFCSGGLTGWYAFELLHSKAMLLPCGIVATLGIGHLCYYGIFLAHKFKRMHKKTNNPIQLSEKGMETAVPVANTRFDEQSNDTDNDDNEDEEAALEKSTSTHNSLLP